MPNCSGPGRGPDITVPPPMRAWTVELVVGEEGVRVSVPLDSLYPRSKIVRNKAAEWHQTKKSGIYGSFGGPRDASIAIHLPFATTAAVDLYRAHVDGPPRMSLEDNDGFRLQGALGLIEVIAIATALADAEAVSSACSLLSASIRAISAHIAATALHDVARKFFAATLTDPGASSSFRGRCGDAILECCEALARLSASADDRELVAQLERSIRGYKAEIGRLSDQLEGAQAIEKATRTVKDQLEKEVEKLREKASSQDARAKAKAREIRELETFIQETQEYYDTRTRSGGTCLSADEKDTGAPIAPHNAARSGSLPPPTSAIGKKRKFGPEVGVDAGATGATSDGSNRRVSLSRPRRPRPPETGTSTSTGAAGTHVPGSKASAARGPKRARTKAVAGGATRTVTPPPAGSDGASSAQRRTSIAGPPAVSGPRAAKSAGAAGLNDGARDDSARRERHARDGIRPEDGSASEAGEVLVRKEMASDGAQEERGRDAASSRPDLFWITEEEVESDSESIAARAAAALGHVEEMDFFAN